jgi:hypothetical protein
MHLREENVKVIVHVKITRVTRIYHSYFIYNIFLAPKVNDSYNAFVYFRGPTTYIHDSYYKTTTLTIENDVSPLR